MVIDTHSHLTDEIYTDRDRILAEMQSDNLESIIVSSACFEEAKKAITLACSNKNLYATIGIHPENSGEFDDKVKQFLIKESQNPKVVAIGEIGLDYHGENVDKELQKKVFVEQLKIAHDGGIPIQIHVRDAYEDLLTILKQHKDWLTHGGIIHCFSGSPEIATEFVKLGFYIAFGGVLTFKNAKKAVESAKVVPLDRLVVETDCPWLCPEPHRGERNEPKYVNFVVQKLADIKQMSRLELEKILVQNTHNIFKKMEN